MKKLFISADIEGVCGIVEWGETEPGNILYPYFAEHMTREVSAACFGATNGGIDSVLVKDAHGDGVNINASGLPINTELFRGWGNGPLNMMEGLDDTFFGTFLIGYHSGAQMGGNPLAHTMNTKTSYVLINDELCTEMMISAYTSALMNVPLLLVTGDETLCEAVYKISPYTKTVAVSRGIGSGKISVHPDRAIEMIREAALEAVKPKQVAFKSILPEHFHVEIGYKDHARARRCGYYPGASQIKPHVVMFDSADFYNVLVFFQFCL